MKLFRWLFGSRKRAPAPETVVARELAERISQRSDEIKSHLDRYQRARDPFAAMMAEMYNRDQMSRVWHQK